MILARTLHLSGKKKLKITIKFYTFNCHANKPFSLIIFFFFWLSHLFVCFLVLSYTPPQNRCVLNFSKKFIPISIAAKHINGKKWWRGAENAIALSWIFSVYAPVQASFTCLNRSGTTRIDPSFSTSRPSHPTIFLKHKFYNNFKRSIDVLSNSHRKQATFSIILFYGKISILYTYWLITFLFYVIPFQ